MMDDEQEETVDPQVEESTLDVFNNEDTTSEETNQVADNVQPPTEATQPVTQSDIKQLIEGLRPQAPAPAQAPTPAPAEQLTQEQIDAKLGRIQVTPDMLQSVLGVAGTPEQARNLQNMLDGVAKYAITSAHYLQQGIVRQNEAALAKINEQITPLANSHRSQQDAQLEQEFMKANPQLVGFEPLAKEVYTSMVAKGMQFNSKEEAFKAVATETQNLMSKLNMSRGDGQQPPASTQQTTRPAMASTTVSSQSAQSGNNTTKKSASLAVFD